ncbi:MAG: FtsB family cell division protein [Alphaproteobacteria bacterium]
MEVIYEIKDRVRQVALPVALFCLVAYFGYHAVQGERGLLAWLSVNQELAQARATQTALAETRANLQRRVVLLRPDSLDRDMLDERAHAILNFGRKDEVIILLPKGHTPSP